MPADGQDSLYIVYTQDQKMTTDRNTKRIIYVFDNFDKDQFYGKVTKAQNWEMLYD